jgi:hypothetical protein
MSHTSGEEIPHQLYGAQMFTVCSGKPTARCYPAPNESSPHPPHLNSLKAILILFSHPCLGPPRSLFPSGIATKIIYASHLYHACATCAVQLILLDLIILIFSKEYKLNGR